MCLVPRFPESCYPRFRGIYGAIFVALLALLLALFPARVASAQDVTGPERDVATDRWDAVAMDAPHVEPSVEPRATDAGTTAAPDADAVERAPARADADAGALPDAGATADAAPSAEPEQGVTVVADRPFSAASSQTIRDRDLQLRPRSRPGDILEVAPGLVVVQHAGGGKANQYFLRGFDADHGTDIAFSLDDVPLNLVTHGHGQGYTDPHFIIPELVDRVEVREGPYFAQDGDFATAGAINLRLRESFERSSVGFEAGMYNEFRFLGILRTEGGPVRGYLAAELAHTDGPFINPLNYNRYNTVGHWTLRLSGNTDLALTLMSYSGAWNASGQIPARLVGQPYMGRIFTQFDSIDPTEGGQSERHQAALALTSRLSADDDLRLLVYASAYRLSIFSNFTYWLNDPVNGDQIEQGDARLVTGFRAAWRHTARAGSWRFYTLAGATLRYDEIDNGLWHSARRQRLGDVVVDHVGETAGGLFVEEQIVPTPWFRAVLGLRADTLALHVADRRAGVATPDPSRNGARQAQLLSPKLNLVFTPVRNRSVEWDLYANFGRGFHSNDARGAVVTETPALAAQCADAMHVPDGTICPVTPLTVATGYELGTRLRLFRRLDLSLAAWMLDLDQETVWNGDDGTTEVAGPTRRLGLTLEGRAEITPWLWADVDVSLVNAAYRDGPSGANAVALAPPWVIAAGVSWRHPVGFFGSVRLRAIGDRPADPAGRLTAQGFALVSAQVGYRRDWFEAALHAENVLNTTWREAQFEEASRLQSEPATCPVSNPMCLTDIKYTPGTPFALTARITLSWR